MSAIYLQEPIIIDNSRHTDHMKKVTGYIDDFRRANILEKMPKTYFFEQEDRPDKMAKYIRRRQQPLPAEAETKKPEELPSADTMSNNIIDSAVTFQQQKRPHQYDQHVKKGHEKYAQFGNFSNEIITKAKDPQKEFSFNQRKYRPPPAIERVTKAEEEKDKEKPIIRKALEQKSGQYDFFQLNKELQQRMRQQKNTTEVEVESDEHESIDYPETISEIDLLPEHKERMKIFTYDLDNITLEEELKPIYQMKLQKESVVLGKGKYKAFQINFLRDLGYINRKPPNTTYHLNSRELDISPDDMMFHDILNIASSRLDRHTLVACVRKQGVSKQEFLNAQRVYDRLKKEEKILVDVDIEAGEQMIQDEFVEEKEEEKKEESETARFVAEITQLKLEIGKVKNTVAQPEEFNKQVEQRLRYLLDAILNKVIEGTEVINPTLEYLKKNVDTIVGNTASGFDRKRLLWFYSDCVTLFRTTTKGENIVNLITKSSNLKGTLVTEYLEKKNGTVTPKVRKATNKAAAEVHYKVSQAQR